MECMRIILIHIDFLFGQYLCLCVQPDEEGLYFFANQMNMKKLLQLHFEVSRTPCPRSQIYANINAHALCLTCNRYLKKMD